MIEELGITRRCQRVARESTEFSNANTREYLQVRMLLGPAFETASYITWKFVDSRHNVNGAQPHLPLVRKGHRQEYLRGLGERILLRTGLGIVEWTEGKKYTH